MNNPTIKEISVQDLKKIIDTDLNCCLIDVRELNEWQHMHIAHAIHIPKDDITNRLPSQIIDKTQAIYLHCKAGVRSLYAAQCLQNIGYTNLYSVTGGILAWESCGYPLNTVES